MTVLKHQKRPAAFLDRDGVLNIDKGYVYRKEDFVWIEGAQEAIRILKERGYLIFIVTNQSGVARGYYSEADVKQLHQWMNEQLQENGAGIDGFYYCPHLPEASVEKYRMDCQCRKPLPGLILKAIDEWDINKDASFLIGDGKRDIEAAAAAGIEGYLFVENNLAVFVERILREKVDSNGKS